MRKLSKTLLSLLLIAAMLASFVVLPAAAEEPAAEQPTEAVQAAETQAADSSFMKIFHLDCGRKYFTKDWILALINEISAAGYTHLQLALGNDGMRFLLDDMSLTVNGTTYSSENVAAAIHAGNEKYHDFTVDELTEKEMDAIIAHAKEKNIEILPLINTPGHMDAILDAATSLTYTDCAYNGSSRTIDVTNDTAVAFTQALLQKYVTYFAGKGCKYFNIGADEYANDKYTGGSMGFGNLQLSGKYGYFIKYVNELATMVKSADMKPVAFNDGIEFYGVTSANVGSTLYKFDKDIIVSYWSAGWSGYEPQSAANLVSNGFKVINTTGDFYYVLGKGDNFDAGYSYASNWSNTRVCGTILNAESVVGATFCVWCDYPGAETEQEIAQKIRLPLRAMAQRMKGESVVLDENELVSGGFKADGTINAATVSDEATGVSVTASGLTGITVAAVDKGTELDGKKVAGAWNIELTTANGSYTDSATVSIPVGKEWLSYKLTGGVLESDGTTVTSDPNSKVENGVLTFTAPHFSTVVVLAEEKQVPITVTVGGTETVTVDGEVSSAYTDDFVTVKTETKNKDQTYIPAKLAIDTLYVSTKKNDTAPTLLLTFEDAGNGQYYIKNGNGQYISPYASYTSYGIGGYWNYSAKTDSKTAVDISTNSDGSIVISRSFKYSGYFANETTAYLTISGSSFTAKSTATNLYLYGVEPVKQTTISFTGKKAGTTRVLIGDTLYTVRVVDKAPDDAMTASSLTIEYWITNSPVYDGTSPSTNHTKSITTTTTGANTDEGIAIEGIAPSPAYTFFDKTVTVYYWQAMRLDEDNKQTDASGDDETADGMTFTHVRYHAGAWQYKTLDGTWHYFLSTDQAVAYYLQKTKVTTEVDTYVKDWGYGTAGTTPNTSDGMGQVALTVAVVYPDGTVSPAEKDMYFKSTTIFNYWADRDIGIIAPRNNSDYTISKITVTDGNRKSNSTANVWYAFDTITWEKVTTDAGTEWYDETTVWDEVTNAGTTPMVNGKNSNITWSAKNTAKLVLIYLEPIEKETNLKVVYYDDTYSQVITNYDIAMKYVTGGPMPSFLTALQNNGKNVQTGVFELDDDAYVTNSSGVNQTFNKDVSTVAGVASQYKSGFYKYVQADISEDGKTMTLHFAVDETKLKSMYVIDFGLPVRIPISSFGMENPQEVTGVTVLDSELSYGTASAVHENDGWYIVYVPNKTLKAVETLRAEFTYSGHNAARLTIGLIPASTVYYEEGFATYDGTWNGTTNKGTGTQALTKLGNGKNTENGYGYDDAYKNDSTNSNATTAVTTAVGSSATFQFKGTGLELYLRTENTNSTSDPTSDAANSVDGHSYMLVQVYEGNDPTNTSSLKRMSFVDVNNLFAQPNRAGYGYNTPCWTVDGMTDGEYTVVVRFVKGETLAIDGFRVTNKAYESSYAQDNEAQMDTAEIRNMVIANAQINLSFDAYSNANEMYRVATNKVLDAVFNETDTITGAVILTDDSNGTDTVTVDKELLNIGPKNEIYLKNGQAVVMQIPTTYTTVQVGMRSLTGDAVTYKINTEEKTMNSTVDMYYKVEPVEGKLVIQNVSEDGILALTKLKVTGAGTTTNDVSVETTPEAIRYAMALMRGIDVPQFTDVAEDAWYHDYVYDLVYRGVVNGMTATTYEPEGKLTRAQFVKLLACSLEEAETLKTYEGQHPFTDSEGHWAETYIAWAKDKGIVEGVSATEFDPEAPITREQMATIFGRYALKQGIELPKSDNAAGSFPDADKISEYAREFVELMRIAGILNGYEDGTFRPQGNATRAEAAKLFSLFLSITDKLAK